MKHSKQLKGRKNPSGRGHGRLLGYLSFNLAVLTGAYLVFSRDNQGASRGLVESLKNARPLQRLGKRDSYAPIKTVKGLPVFVHRSMQDTALEREGLENSLYGRFGQFSMPTNAKTDMAEEFYPYLPDTKDTTDKPMHFVLDFRGIPPAEIAKAKKQFDAAEAKRVARANASKKKGEELVKAKQFDTELAANYVKTVNAIVDDEGYRRLKQKMQTPEYLAENPPLNAKWKKEKSNRPLFDEVIKPVGIPEGLLALDPHQRLVNSSIIAKMSGIENYPKDENAPLESTLELSELIPSYDDLEIPAKGPNKRHDEILKEKGLVYSLACLLACEGNAISSGYSPYKRQQEYVAMLWALVNRCIVGYSSRKLNEYLGTRLMLPRMVKDAAAYSPLEYVENNPKSGKKELALSLMPLVKAFLAGYFNDETKGATHWFHTSPEVLPPLYYRKQGSKGREGEALDPKKLRGAGLENAYVNNCIFVRVED